MQPSPPRLDPEPLSVGDEFDGAALIRAVDLVGAESVREPLHGGRAGVAEGIILADGNHRERGIDDGEKGGAAGAVRAVVPDFEHGAAQIHPAGEHVQLRIHGNIRRQ